MDEKEKVTKTISRQLTRKCREMNITQKQLADMCGLTEAGVSRYISGQRLPRIDILIRMSKALNCSLDYLVYGIEM